MFSDGSPGLVNIDLIAAITPGDSEANSSCLHIGGMMCHVREEPAHFVGFIDLAKPKGLPPGIIPS